MQVDAVTVVTAVLSSGALSAVISGIMTRQANKSVEQLKVSLERGLYVTKAHYDLELDSFKRVWATLNNLRLKVRAFLGPDRFKVSTPEGEIQSWYVNAYPNVIKDFFNAHDEAVRAVTETAPFYPAQIKKAAEQMFEVDLAIISRVGTIDSTTLSESWFEEMRKYSRAIDKGVSEIEELIRSRLETLRIL